MPFERCRPSEDVEHASWVVASLGGGGLEGLVPAGFERYARVHHQLEEGSWEDIAPQYLVRGIEPYEYPYRHESLGSAEGRMGDRVVDALIDVLTEWSGADIDCHFGLWDGWGQFSGQSISWAYSPSPARWLVQQLARLAARVHPTAGPTNVEEGHEFVTSCPMVEWFRDMRLFDGPLSAAATIGTTAPWDGAELWRASPQWWWPYDRSWFVANEIDWPWSYVAGPSGLVDLVLDDPRLESVEVDFDDLW